MLQRVVVMVFLAIGALSDIKYRRIPCWLLTIVGVIAVILRVADPTLSIMEIVNGVAAGAFLLVISALTGGQIGIGDGLLFAVLGILLGSSNVLLLIIALILCAVVAGVLFVAKRVKRKDRLPFVPFVLCAYVIQQLLLMTDI